MKKALLALVLLAVLSGCGTSMVSDYMPYKEIPQDYSLENAKKDNLVVYENGNITS